MEKCIMKRMIIKVKSGKQSKAIDLEVPGEKPIQELLEHLVQGMGWPAQDPHGRPLFYWFETATGPIEPTCSLTQAGIGNGAILYVNQGEALPDFKSISPAAAPPGDSKPKGNPPKFDFEPFDFLHDNFAQDRRASIQPPGEWKKISDDRIS
jgi:hypothetical protein